VDENIGRGDRMMMMMILHVYGENGPTKQDNATGSTVPKKTRGDWRGTESLAQTG
jgi:hypothetical protein